VNRTTVNERLTVLYDADCGFCTRSARLLRWLDARSRLDIRPLGGAPEIADSPAIEVLREAIHVRDRDGRWSVGGAALVRISREISVLRPAGIVAGFPVIRRLVEPGYALVARNRHRISRLLGDETCRIDAAKS